MKRLLVVSLFAVLTLGVSAQNVATATTVAASSTESVVSVPKKDWLKAFSSVKIDGPINVILKRVATADECRISYDTKGNTTSKFKYNIDKNGVLVVSEKSDPKRLSITDVIIYYHSLHEVNVEHAKVEFSDVVENNIFDISVSGGAIVSLEVKAMDIAVECTGTSRLTLGGSTKYLTMRASTAKINCMDLSVVSATVDVSHSAEVRLFIQERLDATTSTGAKLLYKGSPVIFRDHTAIFGGEIININ